MLSRPSLTLRAWQLPLTPLVSVYIRRQKKPEPNVSWTMVIAAAGRSRTRSPETDAQTLLISKSGHEALMLDLCIWAACEKVIHAEGVSSRLH